jgi:hypothetical protein
MSMGSNDPYPVGTVPECAPHPCDNCEAKDCATCTVPKEATMTTNLPPGVTDTTLDALDRQRECPWVGESRHDCHGCDYVGRCDEQDTLAAGDEADRMGYAYDDERGSE